MKQEKEQISKSKTKAISPNLNKIKQKKNNDKKWMKKPIATFSKISIRTTIVNEGTIPCLEAFCN